MRISKAQQQSFRELAEVAFEKRVCQHVRASFPALVVHLGPDALAARVRDALARGRHLGFTWQSSLTGFVDLSFAVGLGFEHQPAFAAALAYPDDDENGRIYAVYDLVSDEEWAEAQAALGERAWAAAHAGVS